MEAFITNATLEVEEMTVSPIDLMIEVIKENSPSSIWIGSPLEAFRSVANTNRGDIGEEFVARYLEAHNVEFKKSAARNLYWDIDILGKKFEVKTASEDSTGGFQFNHIRLDRRYDYLLCLGVRPNEIVYSIWTKGEVAEGKGGTLVRMAEGQSITFKLTKKPASMSKIENLPAELNKRIPGSTNA